MRNLRYECCCACGMVVVDEICVAASICASLAVVPPPVSRTALDSGGMGADRATVVVVRCSMLPDGPLQEKDSIGISTAGFLYLAVVVSFWIIARFDRCRTDSAHAMPPAWPGCAHLAEKIQSVPRQRLFRDATESKVKTTKHLHTGHQTASVNTYLLLCDLGDR